MTHRIPEDAFEAFVAMGSTRSHAALAERYGVSRRAIAKRAAREKWSERLAEIDRKARERSDARLVESIEEMRTRHLQTLRAVHARALAALKEFRLESCAEAIRAAEVVIKLERLVVGEPSERTAVDIEEVIRREYQNWLQPGDCDDDGLNGDAGDQEAE